MGYSYTKLDSQWIKCSGACVPYLQTKAANALAAAAKSKNDHITLNSALRSSAQQWLLYDWYKKGKCGIGLAARPGSSNHEGGRAFDTSYYDYWMQPLLNHGWAHPYPGNDPFHFDYYGVPDIVSANLKAFQRLYNRYSGKAKIQEDGIFGPGSDAALASAPCSGWKTGSSSPAVVKSAPPPQ